MYIDKFEDYLREKRAMSDGSILAYMGDINEFFEESQMRGYKDPSEIKEDTIASYIEDLKNKGRSVSTINRKLSAIRAFYKFLISGGIIEENPTGNIKTEKSEKRKIDYLTIEEVESLLDIPNNTIKGKRDRAILELLYATGIRVNEIVATNLEDINTKIGFVTCKGNFGKARIVPLGNHAKKALDSYLEEARDMFVKNNREEKALFVNFSGNRITRQGLWKILKSYGSKVGLEDRITPHILRNSFAVHMVQNGADLKSLQELLGNEDATAMQIYLYVTKNRIKDVYDKTHPRA